MTALPDHHDDRAGAVRAGGAAARRPYDSPLRRRQAAGTRDRIVGAGSELLRRSSVRDWHALTIRAVAESAGVHERTVYRHFGNEQALRAAVMHRLEEEAGIELESMGLDEVAGVAARIYAHVSSYPPEARPPLDPILSEAKQRQQNALAAAVSLRAPGWDDTDRRAVAAVLDVLWSVAAFERVAVDWQLDAAEATRALTWTIGLVERAVGRGERPR